MHRLGQNLELVPLRARLLQQIGRGRLAGKQQDLDLRQHRPHLDGRIDAVQIGHDHIGNQHIRRKCGGQLQRFFAGIHRAGVKPALVQNHGQRVCDDLFVIGYKNLGLDADFRAYSPRR